MIELVFYSDTNQQAAQQVLEAQHIETQRTGPGALTIDRETLVANLPAVESVLGDYNGHLWAD